MSEDNKTDKSAEATEAETSLEGQEKPRTRSPWYTGLFKVIFFVGAFFLVIFTVMANIGGDDDFYKQSVEDYFKERTGYDAKIKTLNNISFFPTIRVDFEGLELRENALDTAPLASVDHAFFRMGFWDVTLGTGKFKALSITNFQALPGVFTPQSLNLRSVKIEPSADAQAQTKLTASGRYGGADISAYSTLKTYGSKRRIKHAFGEQQEIFVRIGQLNAKGRVGRGVFEDLDIKIGDQTILTGQLSAGSHANQQLDIEGDFEISGKGSKLKFDLDIKWPSAQRAVTGQIRSEVLHAEDLKAGSPLRIFFAALSETFNRPSGQAAISLPVQELDLDVSIDKFNVEGKDLGNLKFPLVLKDNLLKASIKDEFLFSELSGDVALKFDAGLNLSTNLSLKDFDYGALQRLYYKQDRAADISGNSDVVIELTAQSPGFKDLASSLNGNISWIGGEGLFGSNTINIWGRGLLNNLLPDFSTEDKLKVNCSIMDFTVGNGVAQSNVLFIDGRNITIAGEGQYDLTKDNLDITLRPKSKGIELGNIAASGVKVSGSIIKPEIDQDLRGIGRRLGTMLLGAVNPAFLALSLSDLGLSGDHPCRPYFKNEEAVGEVPAVERGATQ